MSHAKTQRPGAERQIQNAILSLSRSTQRLVLSVPWCLCEIKSFILLELFLRGCIYFKDTNLRLSSISFSRTYEFMCEAKRSRINERLKDQSAENPSKAAKPQNKIPCARWTGVLALPGLFASTLLCDCPAALKL